MNNVVLYFICVALISYVVGTINFSKIIVACTKHKDITKMGSGNPGAMNTLRNFGLGIALLSFICEVLKSGLLCLAFKYIFPEYGQAMYFFAGFFLMMGYTFPVWSKFKGGKGVACFAGIFLFSNIWYVALAWFFILAVVFIYLDYAFIISFMYIGGLAIAHTIYAWVLNLPYAWVSTLIIWLLVLLLIYKHRGNIQRFASGNEKRIGFKNILKKLFKHKKGQYIIDEEYNKNQTPEREIIVDDNAHTENFEENESEHLESAVQEDENLNQEDNLEETMEENQESKEDIKKLDEENLTEIEETPQEDELESQSQESELQEVPQEEQEDLKEKKENNSQDGGEE